MKKYMYIQKMKNKEIKEKKRRFTTVLLWSGGFIGLLVMGLLRFIGKYFGIMPLVISMAIISLLLVFATIKFALPAMREKK